MQTTILPAMTAREFIKFISLEDEDVEVFDKDEYQEYKNQESLPEATAHAENFSDLPNIIKSLDF
jgi:hypothetical protein